MKSEKVTVAMTSDRDVSPAALLVQTAGRFESSVHLDCGTKRVNAKSIMGVMTLTFEKGSELTVTADGPDEEEAVAEISRFLRD